MSQKYSRHQKHQKKIKKPRVEHLSTGVSALQKTIAIIGGMLGIITASITILTFVNNNKSKDEPQTPTTVIQAPQASYQDNTVVTDTPASSLEVNQTTQLSETTDTSTSVSSPVVESTEVPTVQDTTVAATPTTEITEVPVTGE